MWSSVINGEELLEIYTKDLDNKEDNYINKDFNFDFDFDFDLETEKKEDND